MQLPQIAPKFMIYLFNTQFIKMKITLKTLPLVMQAFQGFYPKTTNVLIVIGMLFVLRKIAKIIKLLHTMYKVFLRPRRNLQKRYGEKSWAFITGSSEGIGKAIAIELAKEGFNIILSARTQTKLKQVQSQILLIAPRVQIKVLPIDYKQATSIEYLSQRLYEILDLDIAILVNNVGMDVLDYFQNLQPAKIADVITLNCFPIALLSRLFLTRFQKRYQQTKKKAAIVNTGSIAGGQIPIALHNIYSATKAYVCSLSVTLSYQHPNLDIMCLNPSEVSTPMTGNPKQDLLVITPQKCAKGMLDNLGYTSVTNGYWTHQLQSYIYSLLPVCLFNWAFINYFGPQFIKNRENDLKRKKAQALKKLQSRNNQQEQQEIM